jgi:hypothetical protein
MPATKHLMPFTYNIQRKNRTTYRIHKKCYFIPSRISVHSPQLALPNAEIDASIKSSAPQATEAPPIFQKSPMHKLPET